MEHQEGEKQEREVQHAGICEGGISNGESSKEVEINKLLPLLPDLSGAPLLSVFLFHLSIHRHPLLFLRLRACLCARACACVRVRAISVRPGSCMCAWEAGFESEALPPAQVGLVEAPEPRSRSLANVRRNV